MKTNSNNMVNWTLNLQSDQVCYIELNQRHAI